MSCVTCNCDTTKYKCPKCLQFYCSVDCCKKHKEIECTEPPITVNSDKETKEAPIILPFKTADTVDPALLKQLEQSVQLKQLLENRHLRKFLTEIDEAPNAWKAMKVAMQEPLFLELADECLKIVEPPDPNDND